FDSATYVAYRELGRHNGRRIRKARTELGAFLTSLDLPDQDALEALPDKTRARIVGRLEEEVDDRPWVVEELLRAISFMPDRDRVAFLVGVSAALAGTTGSA